MHIGIDDVGTFTPDTKFGYIAATVVRPGRSEEVRDLLRSWEKRIPSQYRGPSGEVKGHALPDKTLAAFVDEVMLGTEPPLRYECLGMELVSENLRGCTGTAPTDGRTAGRRDRALPRPRR